MTITFSEGRTTEFDPLAAAEGLFRDMAEELTQAVFALREAQTGDLAASRQAVKNLLTAVGIFHEERAKVEKLRKQSGVFAAGQHFDLGAARAEVGVRLACLRDAGGH
jgi:hypothetical protein